MTIDEAIRHCRYTALSNAANAIAYLKGGQKILAESCEECAVEHEQLAKWLEELKQRRKAEQVRHGRWIVDTASGRIECSVCGIGWERLPPHMSYCSNCGAKMDLRTPTEVQLDEADSVMMGGAENG